MEIWKSIDGFEGLYEASSYGRVRNVKSSFVLNPCDNGKGYLSVTLHKDNKNNTSKLHRVIAKAFIPNPANLRDVNHIDGDKTNNHISNLEWLSPQDNHKHAKKSGLKATGERCAISKLNVDLVKEIRSLKNTMSQRELAKKFSVSRGTIQAVLNNKTWIN
jgi:hypothetical protein